MTCERRQEYFISLIIPRITSVKMTINSNLNTVSLKSKNSNYVVVGRTGIISKQWSADSFANITKYCMWFCSSYLKNSVRNSQMVAFSNGAFFWKKKTSHRAIINDKDIHVWGLTSYFILNLGVKKYCLHNVSVLFL